jgi:uncharacterized protein YegP (UPF0339 family)
MEHRVASDLASAQDLGHTGNFRNSDESRCAMAAKFEVRQPKAGEFRWVLTSQGRTLATGEAYRRKVLAHKAIDAFRIAATAAPVIDTTVPAASTTTRKAARMAGRAVAKAVVKGARAVEKVERAATKAPATAKKPVKRAAKAVEKTAAKAAKKPAAPRKRTAGR